MKFLCSVLTKIINMTTNITLKLFIPVHEKCRVIRLTFCGHASVQELCLGSSIMDMLHHRGHLSPCRKVDLISKECIFHSFVIMIANKNWTCCNMSENLCIFLSNFPPQILMQQILLCRLFYHFIFSFSSSSLSHRLPFALYFLPHCRHDANSNFQVLLNFLLKLQYSCHYAGQLEIPVQHYSKCNVCKTKLWWN